MKFQFCSSSSFFSFTHNSKTVQHVQIIYTPNDCSTIRNFHFQDQSCMRPKIRELWLQTRTTVFFRYSNLFVLTHITQNYRSCENVSHIQQLLYCRSCIFSGLELNLRYDQQVTAPNIHHSLFPMMAFCTYLHS